MNIEKCNRHPDVEGTGNTFSSNFDDIGEKSRSQSSQSNPLVIQH